ncbi:hypothetical protein BGZ58_001507 [Dissophora ornata]|nr:hypothetical protein BGZ58_001507 [Dissophora ornata]
MTSGTPLDLPEIRLNVANYLSRHDAVQCIQVSRIWHQTFLPFVWEEVEIRGGNVGSNPQGPTVEVLQRYCDMVLNLDIQEKVDARYTLNYSKLRSLSLNTSNGFQDSLAQSYDPTTMIANNPSLLDIAVCRIDIGASFWNAISQLQHVHSMSLYFERMADTTTVNAFWEACTHLRSLEMLSTFMTGKGDLSRFKFPRMRELKVDIMGLDIEDQLEFMTRCPMLEGLSWESPILETWPFRKRLAKLAGSGAWPNLQSLDLRGRMADGDAALILHGMQKATKIVLSSSAFGPQAFEALRRHFSTLRVLNLSLCHNVTSLMILQVLTSCPGLEELQGVGVLAKDIAEGATWVCHSLRTLVMDIQFKEHEQGLQPRVFERLSSLTRLQIFSLGHGMAPEQTTYQNGLDFRLQSGLGALISLKGMRYIKFTKTRQSLDQEDVQWMIDHWKALGIVVGYLNQNPKIHADLVNLLEAHAIEFQ